MSDGSQTFIHVLCISDVRAPCGHVNRHPAVTCWGEMDCVASQGAISQGLCCVGGLLCQTTFCSYMKLFLEHRDENAKWFFEGRTNCNLFYSDFYKAHGKNLTEKIGQFLWLLFREESSHYAMECVRLSVSSSISSLHTYYDVYYLSAQG